MFTIEKGHYALPVKTGKMEQSWANRGYYPDNEYGNNYNDCGVCHGEDQKSPLDPSMKIHDAIDHGDPPSINVTCNGIEVHGEHPRELTDCRICHPGIYSSGRHYLNPGPLNVVEKWEKDPNNCGANSCCTCHKNESKYHEDHEKFPSSYKCSECHGRHCSIIKSP